MESIAKAMRHSRQYQQDINDKMKLDVQFASKLWQVLHCPLPATDTSKAQLMTVTNILINQVAVVPGKLVAMLAGDSTESSPKLFFANVIEINTIKRIFGKTFQTLLSEDRFRQVGRKTVNTKHMNLGLLLMISLNCKYSNEPIYIKCSLH